MSPSQLQDVLGKELSMSYGSPFPFIQLHILANMLFQNHSSTQNSNCICPKHICIFPPIEFILEAHPNSLSSGVCRKQANTSQEFGFPNAGFQLFWGQYDPVLVNTVTTTIPLPLGRHLFILPNISGFQPLYVRTGALDVFMLTA